jgi:PTS system nitrogen regulatory IIA component
MTLDELIAPQHVLFRLRAGDKGAVLNELSRFAAAALSRPAAEIAAALTAREALGSTGVGNGIALPHARLEGLAAPAGFFARLDRTLDWQAIDEAPVDLVCLLLSPASGNSHLQALAAVTRRLREKPAATAIRAAGDAAGVRATLVGQQTVA